MDVAHELIDVVAPPVAPIVEVAAVLLPGGVVVEGRALLRVRVEEVVEVDPVDVVAVDHVHDHGGHPLADLGIPGIDVGLGAEVDQPVGVALDGVVVGEVLHVGVLKTHTVGVEPGVQFEAALVGLLHRVLQRVVSGVAALLAGEVAGPGLQLGVVDGVGGGPGVQEDRVQSHIDGVVEPLVQFGLLLVRGQAGLRGPVDVAHGGEPCSAHLTLVVVRRADRGGRDALSSRRARVVGGRVVTGGAARQQHRRRGGGRGPPASGARLGQGPCHGTHRPSPQGCSRAAVP